MKKIGIRELKNQACGVLRSVREEAAAYVVTLHGEPVALLRPLSAEEIEQLRQTEGKDPLVEMKALSEEVARAWQAPQDGVTLISEQRR